MPNTQSSIIDNRDGNTLLASLQTITDSGRELCIASAFFTLDALLLLSETLGRYEKIRLLFGDDADATQRRKLMENAKLASETDLLKQREEGLALLSPLKVVERLFQDGKIEARCYTQQKFHAKAYLIQRDVAYAPRQGIIGSGNFTRSGMTRNIELNVSLTIEQTAQLQDWFEARWSEAKEDVVTPDILTLIQSQITLYHPYVLFHKTLAVWGEYYGGQYEDSSLPLDPHQEQGFQQALNIIGREQGVMVCDGVGLGKSFIGLALIEHFCRDGRNVLLIAPKNILDSSWKGYLDKYLRRFRSPFGNITEMPMTEFGFLPEEGKKDPPPTPALLEKRRLRDDLMERADVIVIDEAHNFRTTSASRYQNLFRVVQEARGRRKKIILLTATPINTEYADLSAEIALVTQERGTIGGYGIGQIRKSAALLDKEIQQRKKRNDVQASGQLHLELRETDNQILNNVLEALLIQRSRKTCKVLAEAAGKQLRFPQRNAPNTFSYEVGEKFTDFGDMISIANKRFAPGVAFLKKIYAELQKAEAQEAAPRPVKEAAKKLPGIKLAAFLLEQYRYETLTGAKRYQDEARLAGLVYSNTLKQLESSPPAFQGILQSLGEGLIARLQFVYGEEAKPWIEQHLVWVRTPLFPRPVAAATDVEADDLDTQIADGEALDLSGTDTDEWLIQSVKERSLDRKLKDFTADKYDIDRWKSDIVTDLGYLQEIHAATLKARQNPDPKLLEVQPIIAGEVAQGRRVLVFTQSRRTADYLEQTLKIPGAVIARVDSRVEDTRPALLHAFCPGYNPRPTPWPPSVPERVDVLISTDVLAEGVNLQEAGAIINYDIHWNPVRLIQRIGRVDRRLDPIITPETHSFDIYNVLPPPEIDSILQLVGAVENRTLRISKTLGLDASFFKSTDVAGNLIEFNGLYEGEMTGADRALADWLRQKSQPDPDLVEALKTLPPGAFGVWKNAPHDGVFALFVLEAIETGPNKATDADLARFGNELGHPVLALERPGLPPLMNAGEIFDLLRGTVKGQVSGTPSDEKALNDRLKALRNAVRQGFADIDLPRTIVPRLVCLMEWKTAAKKGKS